MMLKADVRALNTCAARLLPPPDGEIVADATIGNSEVAQRCKISLEKNAVNSCAWLVVDPRAALSPTLSHERADNRQSKHSRGIRSGMPDKMSCRCAQFGPNILHFHLTLKNR